MDLMILSAFPVSLIFVKMATVNVEQEIAEIAQLFEMDNIS